MSLIFSSSSLNNYVFSESLELVLHDDELRPSVLEGPEEHGLLDLMVERMRLAVTIKSKERERNMKKIFYVKTGTLALALSLGLALAPSTTFADDSVGEKVGEAVQDTKRGSKKVARNVKQKGCELVNGKMECAGKKVKNKAKDIGDSVEDAVE